LLKVDAVVLQARGQRFAPPTTPYHWGRTRRCAGLSRLSRDTVRAPLAVIFGGVSKAFTSEETPDLPEVTAARRPIPEGVANYVTPRGLQLLRDEHTRLMGAPHEARKQLELEQRLQTAQLVDPKSQPRDEVRFGATVTVRSSSGVERRYQLVGIDEADAARGKIAFVAPIARALLGRQVGGVATVRAPHGSDELEVVAISYE
jgi:transcription elongation factor GreB